YYDALQHAPTAEDVREWYRNAIQTLIRLQQVSIQGLPVYDAERLRSELDLFPEWYIGVHCKAALTDRERTQLERIFALLVARNSKQPYVFVHRDYHSPNLLLPLPDRLDAPGIIDFQDALSGPITYDLASLIMDARTTWEEPQQLDWGIRYWEAARKAGLPVSHDIAEFHADW